jgi:hypothetical protein
MNQQMSFSVSYGMLMEVLNDSPLLLFLNGIEYPDGNSKCVNSLIIKERVINNIYDQLKSHCKGSIIIYYDCGNQFESDLAIEVRKELQKIWMNTYLLGVKMGERVYNPIDDKSFLITLNEKERSLSEYTGYYECIHTYQKDISIDQNQSGYCIIEDGIKKDPWSKDGEIVAIGKTSYLESLMNHYHTDVISYYIWDNRDKKISEIHPGSTGKTDLITHHYHLFQERHQNLNYVFFYE